MSQHAIENAKAWFAEIKELVAAANVGETGNMDSDHDRDMAIERIQKGPLSVLVRSGWYALGDTHKVRPSDGFPLCCLPAEYQILLSTDNTGPVRIIGDLDEHGEPTSATLQWQDWGTPWTQLHYSELPETASEQDETLLSYASHFYFGE